VYGVFKNGEISKGLWHPRSPYLSCCGYPWGILEGKCTGITLVPPKFFTAKLLVIASVLKIALSCPSMSPCWESDTFSNGQRQMRIWYFLKWSASDENLILSQMVIVSWESDTFSNGQRQMRIWYFLKWSASVENLILSQMVSVRWESDTFSNGQRQLRI
jgi:hypothetical protein